MNIWKFIKEKVESGKKAMLIVVIERIGSSPGKLGFKMAVSDDNQLEGSIGGGVMEINMVELAKKMMSEDNREIFIKRQVHSADAEEDKSGLMCSGEQTHAFIPITEKNLKTIIHIEESMGKVKNGVLSLSPTGLFFFESDNFDYYIKSSIKSKTNWSFSEVLGIKDIIYIFGGGHVSVPVSQIFRMLGFRVVVYDNREGLSTIEKNQFANHKEIIDYKKAGEYIKDGSRAFAVIMTVSHAEDKMILQQLVSKDLCYLGMIGSTNKVKKIFDSLIDEGVSKDHLDKVDSPIGIAINSQTVEEIAVSIAAKVIQVKNAD